MIFDPNVMQPKELPKAGSKLAGVKYLIGLWIEGAGVLFRLMWFGIIFGLMMVPLHLVRFLISPTQNAVFHNGHFDLRAGIFFLLMLLYLPFACVMAARISRHLGGPVYGIEYSRKSKSEQAAPSNGDKPSN